MGVGSALMGFFGLVWRILEGIRRVLHLILLLVIFGFILAALHTSIPSVPRTAAQAGEVYLDPMGLVYLDGFSYYRMFLKDAIDKLGVDVNVFRAGTYKSYTDQFSRNDMAPSEREETSVWLESLWNAYQQDVTRARSLPAGALNEFVAQEPAALAAVKGDAAKLALQRGLVTALKSRRQMADELKVLVGEDADTHSFNSIGMNQYLASVRSKHVLKSKADSRVGIVVASGEILDGHQPPATIGRRGPAALLPPGPPGNPPT